MKKNPVGRPTGYRKENPKVPLNTIVRADLKEWLLNQSYGSQAKIVGQALRKYKLFLEETN